MLDTYIWRAMESIGFNAELTHSKCQDIEHVLQTSGWLCAEV